MSKNNSCPAKKTSIGGQALIEGIMMRGPKMTAMAVRNPKGEMVLEKWETQTTTKAKIFKLPIIRGVFGFIDSMRFGYKCLMRSAEISGLEEIEEEARIEKARKKAAKAAKRRGEEFDSEAFVEAAKAEEAAKTEKKESSALTNIIMVLGVVLGVALSLLLFMYLPSSLFDLASSWFAFLKPDNAALASLYRSVFEGVLKIVLLVGYMAVVSLMSDIKKTYQYHGAEHKTIFCYEHGHELTVENIRREGRFHPRCGTSFLILMLLVSIFISFFIDPIAIAITGDVLPTLIRVLVKLLLLPITMGVGYELIKLAGRHDNLFTRIISAPGLWLQRITVLEPTDDMIECAITAFVEVIPEDSSDKY